MLITISGYLYILFKVNTNDYYPICIIRRAGIGMKQEMFWSCLFNTMCCCLNCDQDRGLTNPIQRQYPLGQCHEVIMDQQVGCTLKQ